MEMTKELAKVIMDKVNEAESVGKTSLHDSDIEDILDECKRMKIKCTWKWLVATLKGESL